MLSVLVPLLVVAVQGAAPATAQCPAPTLEPQAGGPRGGGRPVTLRAPPPRPGCDCKSLLLELNYEKDASSGRPVGRHRRPTRTWHRLTDDSRYTLAPDGAEANVTVHLAGWYRVRCCNYSRHLPCDRDSQPRWLDGLNETLWNVSVRSTWMPGLPRRLELAGRQTDRSAPDGFFFPRLEIELRDVTRKSRKVEAVIVDAASHFSYVFGTEVSLLSPGDSRADDKHSFHIVIRPYKTFTCDGGFETGCPALFVETRLDASESPLPASPVTAGTSRDLFVALGVLGGALLASFMVYFSVVMVRQRRVQLWAAAAEKKSPLPERAQPVTVLLLHRGAPAAARPLLDQLKQRLRALNVTVYDLQEGATLNLLQSHPNLSDVLELEPLRDARLVFLSAAAAADDGAGPAGAAAAIFQSLVRYVRNGRLGQDYGRVFAASLGGAEAPELTGLVAGRLFLLPDDAAVMVEHMRAPAGGAAPMRPYDAQAGLLEAGPNAASAV